MKTVEIYTTQTCGYSIAAKALLRRKGIAFTEIDVTGNAPLREAMSQRSAGRRTVPQVFIGGAHVGGCDDLHDLDRRGGLDAMLA